MNNHCEVFRIEKDTQKKMTFELVNMYIFPEWINGTCQYHDFYQTSESIETVFVNKKRNIKKIIIDKNGMIQSFPGVLKEDHWTKEFNWDRSLTNEVRFGAHFSRLKDGRFLMVWTIQPDGRFWEDEDGFGVENDYCIRLYSIIDEAGEFEYPFKIYSIGNQSYYGGDEF